MVIKGFRGFQSYQCGIEMQLTQVFFIKMKHFQSYQCGIEMTTTATITSCAFQLSIVPMWN